MSRKQKTLTIEELRAKQAEITARLEQAEQVEQITIGKEVQRITSLEIWTDIADKWHIIPRDSATNTNESFEIKDP